MNIKAEIRAITLMRYIRKAMERGWWTPGWWGPRVPRPKEKVPK